MGGQITEREGGGEGGARQRGGEGKEAKICPCPGGAEERLLSGTPVAGVAPGLASHARHELA